MGTNFYLRGKPHCPHCSRGPDRGPHIGKSSGGWVFTLRVYPDGDYRLDEAGITEPIHDLEDWLPLFERFGVVNEYDEDISPDEMRMTIAERTAWTATGYELRRHPVDGFCIAHGKGTWDLCVGEFS